MKKVIVVGSGIAGLIAALELVKTFEVTLVTKAELTESNTRWAQGGIAAAMFADDSIAEHIADTLRAGAGLCNVEAVEVLCTEGPQRIRDLISLGVGFDMRDGVLAKGLEAAHSYPRVLHAGGDATGLTIETALVRAVRASNVRLMEHTFASDMIVEDERVAGLEILDTDGERRTLRADSVVLASGGAGQLFLHTTNPEVATGDGSAMALRAGAQLADVEFYQFHPTALAKPGNFLISEAVRGEGAVLRDINGHRFMLDIDPAGELAPRDVVARGIARQMAKQGGQPVLLDATALGEEFLKRRFPSIDTACRMMGLEWWKDPLPVTPAAHYWMGGVRTDIWGRTSLPGLFAVGEVACTGVHGANRLASNSLLESLVFAWRSALALCGQVVTGAWPEWDETAVRALDETPVATEAVTREALQALMWNAAGIERSGDGLRAALVQLNSWHGGDGSVEESETANLLCLSRVVVEAALVREESRGGHFRSDFPTPSEAWRHQLVFARKVAVAC